MTKDDILKMESGPELDELVATKVMGWERLPDGLSVTVHGNIYKWRVLERDSQGNATYVKRQRIPSYSVDLSWAWKVVERMSRIPRTKEEAIFAANTKFAFWWKSADLWSHTEVEAATAICQAALVIMTETNSSHLA